MPGGGGGAGGGWGGGEEGVVEQRMGLIWTATMTGG